ncbi:Mn2+/Fe2+ NRAMP family transporter [Streptomonospora nanhaiensis]|uniref:Mn2+/Fe2+ NRAMP family transporter n=1 Tax=Streptomonospora nanhaiensis TaxID=1323731 RepID=A0A853BKW5_9ACTN|nr:Nramp family divalent metal transporter [Streptomonospora nanhaiensis]NYI95201.1 Mn2+/Fe2+ NRAMP family transporter [Streptomonospora nanhaiensis]
MNQSASAAAAPAQGPADPYALRPQDAQDPPTTFTGRLRHLGPGLVLSAAVVGSGELIVTTSLGAEAGFVLLWLVVISTAVKVWVQMELARWTILTGKPALEGYSQVGPRIGRVGWINWLWIGMDFAKMLQRGGIIGGTASALSIIWPIHGEPLSFGSLAIWTVIVMATTVLLLQSGRYSAVERVTVATVVLFTASIVALALGLPLTEFAYGLDDLGTGLSFMIPAGTVGIAVAMFGLTGVGADEMTTYTYWCMEKGYARWTGPDDGSEARARRAEGWLRVMRLDVGVSWLVCTVCTLSFYVIGASVLHPQGLVPEGNAMISTLARIYTDTMGEWGLTLFVVGAVAVLFSTNVGSTASVPRLWTNTLGLLGVIDWTDMKVRTRTIRILTCCLPPLWASFFLFLQSPVIMVQIGGIAGGIFLLAVVVAVWYLRTTEVDRRFRANRWLTGALVVSSALIAVLGVYSVLEVFGVSVGG